ncbi:MAG: GH3 auxin-responsive promoter family protein [Chloroflexi bacterium]|nr:GH3 auxin-responsive promoter family protein [Chloroflexota bacterium]
MLWAKYCGFLDLSLSEFIDIQDLLLREQVKTISATPLGRRLLRGAVPQNTEEFRLTTPLTTYKDYLPYLDELHEFPPEKQDFIWTSTTGAQARFKWVPYTQRGLNRLLDNLMASFILAAASRRGEVKVWPGDMVLYNAPERPYLSGLATFGMRDRFGFRGILDPEVSESMEFSDRVRAGFQESLGKRVDVIVSMSSVLAKVGESFCQQAKGDIRERRSLSPSARLVMGKAYLKSKLLGRPILPRDIWKPKAIVGWGIDSSIFRDKVSEYWGWPPFELYVCTEGGIMGMQTWNKRGLVFNPFADFFEFIPIEDSTKSREDDTYVPRTVLLDQVEPGKEYEVVITNFYGMSLVRYRVGHFLRFLPRDQWEKEVSFPPFTFLGRADDRIDLAGFTRIDEKTFWEAINLTPYRIREWTARKEFLGNAPLLHVYAELEGEWPETEAVEMALHTRMKEVDSFYRDLERMLGIRPMRVTMLLAGTFDRLYEDRREHGYDLARRIPPRMNSTEEDVEDLLEMASQS